MTTIDACALVERGMGGDANALAILMESVAPVVRVRVARALARRARGRSTVNEVDDLVQDTYAMLFRDGARALRAWDPDRGLSFLGFVGLLAERSVGMALRTNKREPWLEEPTTDDSLAMLCDATARLEARDELRHLLARARSRLSGAGWSYLNWLVLEHRPVHEIARLAGTTPDAIYTWRTRIKRLLLEIRSELHAEAA
jgi:RNA polymerase sigma-70 factor (ECF subfamily)